MAYITISQRQTPCFRALITTEDGTLFDPDVYLATAEELESEEIDLPPCSFSIFRSESELYYTTTGNAQPVPEFQNVEIDPIALIAPDEVEENDLNYNFSYVPESRKTFPFTKPGVYFVDFTIYPKVGAAIVWLTPIKDK